MNDFKRGLVLEGGSLRGMFTAGCLDVIMEHDLKFDGVISNSAGAVFGCNYKSHQIGRSIRYNKKYISDSRYSSVKNLLLTGNIFGTKFCYDEIPNKLDPFDWDTFYKDPSEFYVTCTDIYTGKAVYHECGADPDPANVLLWMRASASLPLLATIVDVDGHRLLDGGMADSIPVRHAEEVGYNRNVVILTQPLGFVKQPNNKMPLIRLFLHQYPNLVKAVRDRHLIYNETTDYVREKELKGELFVIRPDAPLNIPVSCKDPKELQRVYDEGRRTMERELEKMTRWLSGENE